MAAPGLAREVERYVARTPKSTEAEIDTLVAAFARVAARVRG